MKCPKFTFFDTLFYFSMLQLGRNKIVCEKAYSNQEDNLNNRWYLKPIIIDQDGRYFRTKRGRIIDFVSTPVKWLVG